MNESIFGSFSLGIGGKVSRYLVFGGMIKVGKFYGVSEGNVG